jgi:probable HAF family extracellular repeat protein
MPIRLAAQPPRYTVTDLGPSGSPFSQATFLNNSGLVTGVAAAADGTQHAVIWRDGAIADVSKPGLGGPNSGAGGVNEFDQIVGQAETSSKDPNNENFCGYGTGLQCLPFVWRYGVITALPLLGGTNGSFGAINNLGQVAGFAENGNRDPECPGKVAVNGTGPQVLDFEAVIWGPRPGQIQELPPLPGDTVGMAFGINDYGQAVGTSGRCGNTVIPGFAAGPHAVFWDSDGSVHDLGNLGGTVNNAFLGSGTVGFVINNRGEVTGQSDLKGDNAFHPFLWTSQKGMQDLGLLPGDLVGARLAMNNAGDVVGASISAPGPASGNPRAFLWRNGTMTDLNSLIPADSPLYLLTAFGIDDAGEIAGFGVTDSGDLHAFLITPGAAAAVGTTEAFVSKGSARPSALSENARKVVLWQLSMRGQ